MPQKVGNGGHGQENYDPNTGQYIKNSSGLSSNFIKGFKKGSGFQSTKDIVPKKHRDGRPRKFLSDYSEQEKNDLYNKYANMYGGVQKMEDIRTRAKTNGTKHNNSPERENLRQQAIFDEFKRQYDQRTIKFEKLITYVVGLPASGKSTISNKILNETGSVECGADLLKEYLPEFKADPDNVSAVQSESTMMMGMMADTLSEVGCNILIGKTGKDTGAVLGNLKKFLSKGYKANLVLVDIPLEEALERNGQRYLSGKTKRIVAPNFLMGSDKRIFDFCDALVNSGMISNFKVYTNDVEAGKEPELLYEE